VFLAGGISGCPDWQKEMIARFKGVDDHLVLVNPRRASFDITNPSESDFQIEWEATHLHMCDAAIFWFPFHTLCPITLFEIGKHAEQGMTLFVGCHPAYARAFDVRKQLSLMRPDIVVHDSFTPLVEQTIDWYHRSVDENRFIAESVGGNT
jgi:hypothetical protein